MRSPDPILRLRDLNAWYGPAHVLQGVDLELGAEPVALIGRNGMGKTTLCRAIMGLTPRTSGSVRLAGRELAGRGPYRIGAAGIGYVPQGRRMFPSLTTDEHLRMLGRRRGQRWTPERVYDVFPRLAERRRVRATLLSGGEQQMLAIGRALVTNPQLLIMDEPSEGLAPAIVEELVDTCQRLSREEGVGMLVVEQNLGVAAALAQRQVVLVAGRIVAEVSAAELLADEAAQQRYLGVTPREAVAT
jgi:branched-chain amino acid transport system ATP-binding protein